MADMSEDDVGMSVVEWSVHDAPSPSDTLKSDMDLEDRQGIDGPSQPIQKRRRVTRACDECRRKKIKCDGKQPCTHCSVYSYGTLFPLLFFFFLDQESVLLTYARMYIRQAVEPKEEPGAAIH